MDYESGDSEESRSERTFGAFEVFGRRTFADAVSKIRAWTYRKFWGEQERLDDAVSVATLALLENWIPRYATSDTKRNFNFAVSYGCHRVTDHLLAEFQDMEMKVSLDTIVDDDQALGTGADNPRAPLLNVLADPAPTAEEMACSEAVVKDVRRLVDELDWEACLTTETTREESRRTGTSQSTVNRRRARAKNCVRSAYLACI